VKKMTLLFVLLLAAAGCGSNNDGSSGTSGTNNNAVSTTGDAQGVYSGNSSNGYSFESMVLPNDKFVALYGTSTSTQFLIYGMITGQGASGTSTYTASSVTDFFYTGVINSASVTASYVAGSSLNGTLTENGNMITFTGTSLPSSSFNYNTQASISAISGTWIGILIDGSPATVTIGSNGSVSGSSSGCSFSGTVTPDSSNKNFFDVSLIFGASPCALPNQTASGIGIEYLLSNGTTHQLLAGVTVGTSEGTVFAAER
jgi:hypothetical protein